MKKESNKEIDFETSIKELEKIANELESGELNLEDSIKKFEEGMLLSKKCNEFLEDAEKRITILVNDEKNIKEENFIEQNENKEEK